MSKQDRQGARTVAELDRRYNVKKAMGVANDSLKLAGDSQKLAKEANNEVGKKLGKDDNDQIVEMINKADKILKLLANRLIIESDNFTLSEKGSVVARDITIQNGKDDDDYSVKIAEGVIEINSPTELIGGGMPDEQGEIVFQQIDLLHFNIRGLGVWRLFIVVDLQDIEYPGIHHFGISPVE